MYPFQPPQIAALANRFNPQPMNSMQDGSAPLVRQAPPATSGQIQPSGLQPQPGPMGMMRPQVAALAQQYTPQVAALAQQYTPQFNPQFMNTLQQAQFALGQQMQPQQAQMQNGMPDYMSAMYAQAPQFWNPQPAYNPGFTQAGQAQNNFLTTPTQPQPAPVTVPQGGFAPATLTAGMPAQMQPGGPQPARHSVPGGMNAGLAGRLSGGVHGLARYYTR